MDVRRRVVEALRHADAPMSVTALAGTVGAPATTVRFHLRSLTDDGLVVADSVPHDGPGRPRLLYRARPAMDPAGPRSYALLAEVLVGALDGPGAAQRAVAAGREWGRRRADPAKDPMTDLVDVLDEIGFAPQPSGSGDAVRLHRCPFLELAQERPAVTCSVHRGIMQGVLGEHHTDLHLQSLDAFVDGDHCLARITRTGDE